MKEKELLTRSGRYTVGIVLLLSLFWFLYSIQTSFGYSGTGTTQDLKSGSRFNGDLLAQPFNGSVTIFFGTQSTSPIGTGTAGYIGTNTSGLPKLRYSYTGGSSTITLDGFTTVAINNVTIAGQGTTTATTNYNGANISPTEVSYLDGMSENINSKFTTVTGSITNHSHTGSDGTAQISHTDLTPASKGTQTHTQIDTFIAREAQPSGLATLDANSKVVQNPASGTSTPGVSKITMSLVTGFLDDSWLSSTITKLGADIQLGTETTGNTNNITEGSTNKYYTDARVTAVIGSSSISDFSDTHNLGTATEGQVAKKVGGIWQGSASLANMTFTGNTNFPSGIWDSNGNIGIGTTTPSGKLHITLNPSNALPAISPSNQVIFERGGDSVISIITTGVQNTGQLYFGDDDNEVRGRIKYDHTTDTLGFAAASGDGQMVINSSGNIGVGTTTPGAKLDINGGDIRIDNGGALWLKDSTTDPERHFYLFNAGDALWFREGNTGNPEMSMTSGNVGIGVTSPGNILTLPVSSATDPIADAWTLHCLTDYKEIGTETVEMIQSSANDKVKNTPVSLFTKKVIITDEEAEREPKQQYKNANREAVKADSELYKAKTGVNMQDDSYVDELLESMWKTKADKIILIEANKQKLISEKKALPKFQRKNYGIVAEDAPPEAQVLREDGSLQGVDTSVLIGILWANAQKQDERIVQLETQVANLSSRLLIVEGR